LKLWGKVRWEEIVGERSISEGFEGSSFWVWEISIGGIHLKMK
jgi:hypothetical protein